jgi:hypothetical protein
VNQFAALRDKHDRAHQPPLVQRAPDYLVNTRGQRRESVVQARSKSGNRHRFDLVERTYLHDSDPTIEEKVG